MHNDIKEIISKVNYASSCRGGQGFKIASGIVNDLFKNENLDIKDWEVSEIPLADDSGKYPIVVVICIINQKKRIGVALNITAERTLHSVEPDDNGNIVCATITEAIAHPTARF